MKTDNVEELKVGIIGCGVIAAWAHLPALVSKDIEIPWDGKHHPEMQDFSPYPRDRHYEVRPKLQAICDLNGTYLGMFSKQSNVSRCYTDHHQMLEKEKLDAVLLTTFYTENVKLIPEIAAHGVHIMVEKPLAKTVAEGRIIAEAVRKHQVKLHVAFMRRFFYAYRLVKQMLDAKEYGHVESVNMDFWAGSPQSFDENGIHAFDIVQHLGGKVVRVYAEQQGESTCVALRFENGAVGSLAMAANSIWHNVHERIRVNTAERTQITMENGYRVTVSRPSQPTMHYEPPQVAHYVSSASIRGFSEEWRSFLHAIRTDGDTACNVDEGLRSLVLKEAILKSVEERQPISVNHD